MAKSRDRKEQRAGGIEKTGVDDAAFFGSEFFAGEGLVEGFEEFLAFVAVVFCDDFFEVRDGVGIGDFVAQAQVREAETASDLEFGGFVAEAVEFLEDENFEHEDWVEGRWSPLLQSLVA